MLTFILILFLIVGLVASFAPVFVFNNFSEYKNDIQTVIQSLVNEGYNPREICNILNYNDVNVFEIELKQKK